MTANQGSSADKLLPCGREETDKVDKPSVTTNDSNILMVDEEDREQICIYKQKSIR